MRSLLGCLGTACLVVTIPGAVIVRLTDSGPVFYVGAAMIGLGSAGFLMFTAAYWAAALFTDDAER